MRVEIMYYGPGHCNWTWRRAFGRLDRGRLVTTYCLGLIAIRLWRY